MIDQTELSDMVSKIIEHKGRRMRIVGYEMCPKSTRTNTSCKPIFWLVEADEPRRPPYASWEMVLCEAVPIPEDTQQEPTE